MLTTQPIVIDLFAGAGGFGLGFNLAGFHVPLSLEMDTWACDTLRYNHPDMVVLQQDIREFTTRDSVRSVCTFNPDIVIGGPPCQGFSIAGPAKKDPRDPRNSLFINFAQWIGFLARLYPLSRQNQKGRVLSSHLIRQERVSRCITCHH